MRPVAMTATKTSTSTTLCVSGGSVVAPEAVTHIGTVLPLREPPGLPRWWRPERRPAASRRAGLGLAHRGHLQQPEQGCRGKTAAACPLSVRPPAMTAQGHVGSACRDLGPLSSRPDGAYKGLEPFALPAVDDSQVATRIDQFGTSPPCYPRPARPSASHLRGCLMSLPRELSPPAGSSPRPRPWSKSRCRSCPRCRLTVAAKAPAGMPSRAVSAAARVQRRISARARGSRS
jgi:hypothetical protein